MIINPFRLYKLLQKGKINERIYFNLGMLAMDDKEVQLAEKWFKKAIQVIILFHDHTFIKRLIIIFFNLVNHNFSFSLKYFAYYC